MIITSDYYVTLDDSFQELLWKFLPKSEIEAISNEILSKSPVLN